MLAAHSAVFTAIILTMLFDHASYITLHIQFTLSRAQNQLTLSAIFLQLALSTTQFQLIQLKTHCPQRISICANHAASSAHTIHNKPAHTNHNASSTHTIHSHYPRHIPLVTLTAPLRRLRHVHPMLKSPFAFLLWQRTHLCYPGVYIHLHLRTHTRIEQKDTEAYA